MTALIPSFRFAAPPRVLFEAGASRDLAARLETVVRGKRVFVVTDKGVRGIGLLDAPLASLEKAGYAIEIYDAVVADPPQTVILSAADAARAFGPDLILGFGGGSPMDAAKLVAALIASDQPIEQMYGVDNAAGPRAPLVLVPTTSGTGSEATPIAVVTTGETTKKGVSSALLIPDLALLDPDLTLGLPPATTAATGIDAMVHAIEAYTSAHKKNPISDAFAREAMSLLSRNIVAACVNGSDSGARGAMLLGAHLAGQAFANAPVAAVHALAYPLGGVFHIPHGLSNALMLGPVLRFNASAAAGHYAELERSLDPSAAGSDAALTDAFIARLERLSDETGVARRLRDVGVSQSDLPRLAGDAMLQTRLLVNNPRPVEQADALRLYEEAW